MAEILMTYEDVLEYLADRDGDAVTISSYPASHITDDDARKSVSTLLGLRLSMTLGAVEGVAPHEEQWLEGRAGVRIRLDDSEGRSGGLDDDGLVLTREWFGGGRLSEDRSSLTVLVFANSGARPIYPPVGQEPALDEERDEFLHDLVGWGFGFDFDGDPPYSGRWSDRLGSG